MQNKKLFRLNVPAELTTANSTNIFVPVDARRYSGGNIGIEFLGIDTLMLLCVKDWFKVYEMAQKIAERKFEQAHPEEEEPAEEFYLTEIAL